MTKIAIVKLASIGDVVQTTHILPLLSNKGYQVDFITNRACAPVLYNLSEIHFVKELPNIGANLWQTIIGCIVLLVHFMLYRYSKVLIFHRSKMLNFLVWLTGHRIAGFYYNKICFFVADNVYFDLDCHRSDRNLSLLSKALGISEKKYDLLYRVTAEEKQFAASLLKNVKEGRRIKKIAINAGGGVNLQSSMPARRWPVENYMLLLNSLCRKNKCIQIVLLGGREDVEIHSKIEKTLQGHCQVSNFTGRLPLRQSAAVLGECELFIGNDSVLLFIAAALQLRTLGLFGPTDGGKIMPKMPNCEFLQSLHPMAKCYNPTEGTKGLAYSPKAMDIMRFLTVQSVWKKTQKMLRNL